MALLKRMCGQKAFTQEGGMKFQLKGYVKLLNPLLCSYKSYVSIGDVVL